MNDLQKDLIKYAKDEFGYDIVLEESETPDTFESIFRSSFIIRTFDSQSTLNRARQ